MMYFETLNVTPIQLREMMKARKPAAAKPSSETLPTVPEAPTQTSSSQLPEGFFDDPSRAAEVNASTMVATEYV